MLATKPTTGFEGERPLPRFRRFAVPQAAPNDHRNGVARGRYYRLARLGWVTAPWNIDYTPGRACNLPAGLHQANVENGRAID